jgi:hypothetical protein
MAPAQTAVAGYICGNPSELRLVVGAFHAPNIATPRERREPTFRTEHLVTPGRLPAFLICHTSSSQPIAGDGTKLATSVALTSNLVNDRHAASLRSYSRRLLAYDLSPS